MFLPCRHFLKVLEMFIWKLCIVVFQLLFPMLSLHLKYARKHRWSATFLLKA